MRTIIVYKRICRVPQFMKTPVILADKKPTSGTNPQGKVHTCIG